MLLLSLRFDFLFSVVLTLLKNQKSFLVYNELLEVFLHEEETEIALGSDLPAEIVETCQAYASRRSTSSQVVNF